MKGGERKGEKRKNGQAGRVLEKEKNIREKRATPLGRANYKKMTGEAY